ncbi:acetyltransferase [Lyngbya aestuarii]|uniref:acetyltransferase n=1 Tax=Lyngbya aestuarii TaxID=118322 RepID=UPI00403D78FF
MFLQHKPSGDLVEVLALNSLFDPCHSRISGRFHAGEEMQDPETFSKLDLMFPSGESLPQCWLDAHYRRANGVSGDLHTVVV